MLRDTYLGRIDKILFLFGGEPLVKCPECNSDDTKINAEVIYADSISFDWKKKGKGIKQIKYNIRNRGITLSRNKSIFCVQFMCLLFRKSKWFRHD